MRNIIHSFFVLYKISNPYSNIGDCMDEYIRIKNKHRKYSKKTEPKTEEKRKAKIYTYMSKFFITVVLLLITLIVLKQNPKYKEIFHKYIFEQSISFAQINKMYEKKFGSSIPFKDLFIKKESLVFEEKLAYKEVSKYLDGAKLTVEKNYLVPVRESGMVVFIGSKEGYGNVVIIEDTGGIETWYGNLSKANVKVYDYVEKGDFLGEVDGTFLYMVFKENGKKIDYTKYLS